jgi:hypothetical protein
VFLDAAQLSPRSVSVVRAIAKLREGVLCPLAEKLRDGIGLGQDNLVEKARGWWEAK